MRFKHMHRRSRGDSAQDGDTADMGRRRFARDPSGLEHGRHRGGPRGERRSGLGRFFAHGDLRLLILHLIAEKPRHGYEIIKEIEDRVAGAYSPSPGVIYPTLTMLEELGHLTVTPGEGGKKLNSITPEGQAFLDANQPVLQAILARIAEAARTYGGGPSPLVIRAMENLKLAMRLRMARGPLTPAEAESVAAALDAAANAVERS